MQRVLNRLLSVKRPVQQTVITVPPELRERYRKRGGAKLWAAHLREFVGILKERFGFLFGYVRTHPTGEDNVVFHPHANILWVQGKDCPGFRPGKLDVEAMRFYWKSVLGYRVDTEDDVDLWTHFLPVRSRVQRIKLAHRIKYTERSFPGWRWAGMWARWYGRYPRKKKDKSEYLVHGICPHCKQVREFRLLRNVEESLHASMIDFWFSDGIRPPPMFWSERMEVS